jgi:hypothetical protein
VDQTRLQDLEEAAGRFLAWESIVAEKDTLNLSQQQVKHAEDQRASADRGVTAVLPEAYQWLLVPVQSSPQAAVEWQSLRLAGQDALAVRASKKLRNDELLVTALAGTRLRLELDRVPLWRGSHVAIGQLMADFASYLYLPRLKEPHVLLTAIANGLALLTWEREGFAYAEGWDETAKRYQGLRCGQQMAIVAGDTGLLVRPEVAKAQQEAERPAPRESGPPDVGGQAKPPTKPDDRVAPGTTT